MALPHRRRRRHAGLRGAGVPGYGSRNLPPPISSPRATASRASRRWLCRSRQPQSPWLTPGSTSFGGATPWSPLRTVSASPSANCAAGTASPRGFGSSRAAACTWLSPRRSTHTTAIAAGPPPPAPRPAPATGSGSTAAKPGGTSPAHKPAGSEPQKGPIARRRRPAPGPGKALRANRPASPRPRRKKNSPQPPFHA